jgi:glycosidase
MNLSKGFIFLLVLGGFLFSCGEPQTDAPADEELSKSNIPSDKSAKPNVPDWVKNANIYEVNLRQYTPEGTFEAFSQHLPRLKEMGVDILWFMPIHPISEKNRKGELGSPYAIADYKNTNPDFGSLEDFQQLVDEIHSMGMHVIIDWVANHTGWDNHWIKEHPEWYTQDSIGNIIDPINPETGKSWGWTDVADLNFDVPEMRLAMIDAMSFWVTDMGIDGFRCDVAHNVPLDFWSQATDSLYSIKPLFMLAEAEEPKLRNSGNFAADYGWSFHKLMNEIFKNEKNALDIDVYLAENTAKYKQGFHMHFTSNHDENTWAGTVFDRMGDGHLTFAVLASTIEGMPLIYSGQESANKKRLAFFEQDTISWGDYEYAEFYKNLNELKHNNPALWNGDEGGKLVRINTDKDQHVFAFMRQTKDNRVVVILNLSKVPHEVKLQGADYVGEYNNIFVKGTTALTEDMMVNLGPWEYLVLSNF